MFRISARRKNTDSYKWDFYEGMLPFGVADSDYKAPLRIRNALRRRIRSGAFGYTMESKSYRTELIRWTTENYGYTPDIDNISVSAGIVFGINALLKTFTQDGDKVVIQQPVYNAFFSILDNNSSTVINNPLLLKGGRFVMDLEDLDRKLDGAKIFILCSPHNPVGRVWSADEIGTIVQLCKKHDVILISDEIHCDFMFEGVSFQSAARYFDCYNKIIVCNAPSKTFNLAGFFTSNIIFADKNLKQEYDKTVACMFSGHVNLMGMIAAETAYKKCGPWMRRQNRYIEKNYSYLKTFFKKNLPLSRVSEMDGTYLCFVDLNYLGADDNTIDHAMRISGISLNTGGMYGEDYQGWVRINIACPSSQLRKGLKRILNACRSLEPCAAKE